MELYIYSKPVINELHDRFCANEKAMKAIYVQLESIKKEQKRIAELIRQAENPESTTEEHPTLGRLQK